MFNEMYSIPKNKIRKDPNLLQIFQNLQNTLKNGMENITDLRRSC